MGPRHAYNSGEQEMPLVQATAIVGAIFAVIGACTYYCCGCCFPCCCFRKCRRRKNSDSSDSKDAKQQRKEAPDTVQVGDAQLKVDHLLQRKELTTSYMLWAGAGLLGAHHFYLDRLVHGVLAMLTLNFFALGWIFDSLALPVYVKRFNARTAPVARGDGTCRRVCWRLPVAIIFWTIAFFVGFLKLPRSIHHLGIVDLDATIAETAVNPYELLGIQPDAGRRIAVEAFQRESLRLQWRCPTPDSKNPVRTPECEEKVAELKKAYEFIKWKLKVNSGEAAMRSGRDKHDDHLDVVGLEWQALRKVVNDKAKPLYSFFDGWFGSEESSSTEEDLNSDL